LVTETGNATSEGTIRNRRTIQVSANGR